MAAPVDRLVNLAETLLAAVADHWPVDAEPLPDLQYIANGAIAWDGCALLAVSMVRTFPATEGDITLEGLTAAPPRYAGVRAAQFDVYLLRCVPDLADGADGSIIVPAPADVQASAVTILTDAQALYNAIVAGVPGCSHAAPESWTAAGPEGGMGGGIQRVRLL